MAKDDKKEPESPGAAPVAEEDRDDGNTQPLHPGSPVDSSYVWVSSEATAAPPVAPAPAAAVEEKPEISRTGSESVNAQEPCSPKEQFPFPPPYSYSTYLPTSPSPPPLDECVAIAAEIEAAAAKSTVGKTYYPVKAEGSTPNHPVPKDKSVSPRVGRTKGERAGRNKALINGLPKLQRFSPPIAKPRVREDSAPLDSEQAPVKCARTLSDAA